jgi:hypothetical protein
MAREAIRTTEHEMLTQCQILRDLVRFQPVSADPGWLDWEQQQVVRLAQPISDEDRFEHLPILADALEEAGCTHTEMLAHLRGPGPHYRGCWALDVVLNRK